MKKIYQAKDIIEAHIVDGMLKSQGLQSYVSGHYLQGGVGEIATIDFAGVYIVNEQYQTALPIIADYETKKHQV